MKSNLLIIITFSLVILISCNKKAENVNENITRPESKLIENKTELDTKVALNFINQYCELCNQQFKKETTATIKIWIEKNDLLTESFKKSYNDIIKNAEKEDPELGLDFDPIFDAQDFPENGFELFSIDDKQYLTVNAKNEEGIDFFLKIKVINLENKWLVDGVGIINIPEMKRAKR